MKNHPFLQCLTSQERTQAVTRSFIPVDLTTEAPDDGSEEETVMIQRRPESQPTVAVIAADTDEPIIARGVTLSADARRALLRALAQIGEASGRLLADGGTEARAVSVAELKLIESFAREGARLVEQNKAAKRITSSPPAVTLLNDDTGFLAAAEARRKASISFPASILVVDDDPESCNLLRYMLEDQGYRVGTAETGEQGLQMARTQCYDLILLDLMLPGISGYDVLKQLKRDQALRHLPVIILSGIDETGSTVRCIEIGAEDYLSKPFSPVLLQARIGASLEKKQLRDQEHSHLKRLEAEQQKSDRLLLNILPKPIADRLRAGEKTIVDSFPDVTVLFADLAGFTAMCAHRPAPEVWRMLNEIFSEFDQLVEQYQLEKIKTIGDAYMIVGGLPTPRADHARAIAEIALDMQEVLARFNARRGSDIQIRIGINTGPVIAGIIGRKKFIYDLWGDTVNTASRMESQGQPGQIQVTETTRQSIEEYFRLSDPDTMEVRGKGPMRTSRLLGRNPGMALAGLRIPA